MRPVLAAVLALAATSAVAQQAPMAAPGTKSTAGITGGTYTADPGHTLVTWTLDHLGFSPYTGIFGDVTGTLSLSRTQFDALVLGLPWQHVGEAGVITLL